MGATLHLAAVALLLAIDTTNVIGQGFFMIMFGDLEMDYINPIDLCNQLNRFILPEAALQAFGTVLSLLAGEWLLLFLMIPITAHNVYRIQANQYLLDATEIFKTLPKQKMICFVKVIWHILLLFYLIFRLVMCLINW